MRTCTLWCFLLPLATGCFVVDDLDGFTQARSCDLDFTGRDFRPHIRQLFRFDVIRTIDGEPDTRERPVATAVFDPLLDANFVLRMPNAVPAPVEVGEGFALEFFGDFNENGLVDETGTDHTWREPDPCAAPFDFSHNVDFQNVQQTSRTGGPKMVIEFCGADFDFTRPTEVRVTGTVIDETGIETTQAIAFHRAQPRDVVEIQGVFTADQRMVIEALSDGGQPGVADGDDDTWVYSYFATGEIERCEDFEFSCDGPRESGNFACFQPGGGDDPGEIRLIVSSDHPANQLPLADESWWQPLE